MVPMPRLFVSLLWLLLPFVLGAQSAQEHVRRGMSLFVENRIEESIGEFDKAAEMDPREAPELWQRGIAYYYAGRFEDGRRQFETHRLVNPNDVENAAWWYLCMARLGRHEEARAKLLPVGPDARVPMAEIYSLYAGKGSEKAVMDAVQRGNPDGEERSMRLFYARLYLALYAEAGGDRKAARRLLEQAVALKTGGYMGEVARIHLARLK